MKIEVSENKKEKKSLCKMAKMIITINYKQY